MMESENTIDCRPPRLLARLDECQRTAIISSERSKKMHRRTLSTATASSSPTTTTTKTMKNHSSFNSKFNTKTIIMGTILLTLVIFLMNPTSPTNQLVEGGKVLKAAKSLAKGLVMQQLTTRKNFLPLPVPIPVPIEINDPPVYIKGKPKYVNVYKPKPTPQPVVKPTTVYHMPVYSPTYEYMSMDPMSMYGSMGHMMYPAGAANFGNMKSSVHTDSDSSSATAGVNFNDYDDEFGNYYVGKSSAAKRRRRMMQLNSIAANSQANDEQNDFQRSDREQQQQQQQSADNDDNPMMANEEEEQTMLLPSNDEEQIDNEESGVHRRSKRQVYYQSGYNGERNCHGFPLEINVKSRIKMDQIFPIYGRSQMRKCIKVGQPLLPPVEDHHYPEHY